MTHLPDDRYVRPSAKAGGRAPSAARAHVTQVETDDERSFGRFAGLTFLGTILPGSGLLLADRKKSGGALLSLFVLGILCAAAYLWVRGPRLGAMRLATDPAFLQILWIAAIVVVTIWVASIIWTAVLTWPRPAGAVRGGAAGLFTMLLCALLVAPTAIGVRDVVVHRDLLTSLFNQVAPGRTGVSPNLAHDDPWAGYDRVNVMLIGGDSAPNRPGLRTDSMMLASIDTKTGDTILFGLPRNLERVPFPPSSPLAKLWPNGFRCPKDCLLNDVWMQGEDHPELHPGDPKPGATALNEAVTGITGLTPDYDVVVNMASFSALVDAMGGVDITVKDRVPIGGKVENGRIVPGSIHGWIEPGPQHLDGYHAMWFSRGRATTDDFDRMRRQRCMVGALVKQINPAKMIERYPQIAKVAKDNIYTNIPQQHLAAWAELATRMQQGEIKSLPFSNKVINVGNPDFGLIQQMVQDAIYGTATAPTPTSSPSATKTPTTKTTKTSTSSPSSSPTPTDGVVKVSDAC